MAEDRFRLPDIGPAELLALTGAAIAELRSLHDAMSRVGWPQVRMARRVVGLTVDTLEQARRHTTEEIGPNSIPSRSTRQPPVRADRRIHPT